MSTNSETDHTNNSDDEYTSSKEWRVIQSKALDNPSLGSLNLWIDQDLAALEHKFASFVTNSSLKTNLRKSRGSPLKH
jgi:hypothetical protein